MPSSHPLRWIIVPLCAALAAFGCSGADTPQGETGSLSLDLVLAGDIEIDVVDWQITGNGMDMGGSVDVSAPGSTASVEVYGLPVGQEPYVVELSAVSVDQQVTCRGSAEFDVEVGVSTPVMVILNCKLPQELGDVRVNGKFNICAQLTKMVVAPLQTSVGNDISLFSTASDEEGDPITYMWSSDSGSIADPMAASTTYTCTEVGDDDITVLVTDDDGSYCMSMWTVRVTCVAGEGNPCDDVTCEDDGNECTSEACNPGTGQCETSNVADGTDCDGGAGMCSAGTCVAKELCMDVVCEDDGNDCTSETCNPDTGQCETSNVENGTSCNDASGMCMNGECVVNDPCDGKDCDAGNVCVAAECNEATGDCVTSNVDSGVGCALGELTTNGGFELGNLDFWTPFCTGPNNGTCGATMAEANGGSWSGNVATAGAPANPLIKQANIGIGIVTPNSPISISFDLKGTLSGAGGEVKAELISEFSGGGGTVESSSSLFPTDEWKTYSFVTTTGGDVGGGVTLQLVAICGAVSGCGVDAYFDNVSVVFGSGAGTCDGQGSCLPSAAVCENPITDCTDDGNECTDPVCTAGVCDTLNNTDPCDGGAGTCNAGQCVPNAAVLFYEQDFESLDQASLTALGGPPPEAGFLVFGNEYQPDGTPIPPGYGPFPAPNNPPQAAFSLIVAGQGGAAQGAQQLVIISDYQNAGNMNAGNLVEANTFQEPFGPSNPITAADFGTYTFSFDAKLGDLVNPPSTAFAFVKTLDPNAGFATTNFLKVVTTAIPSTWANYSITLVVDAALLGQILQFGFSATTTNFVASGVFYDNLLVTVE